MTHAPYPLSRDPDDDSVLACALASGAKTIISKDKDLLVLKKPFGIEIMTPRQFLTRMRRKVQPGTFGNRTSFFEKGKIFGLP